MYTKSEKDEICSSQTRELFSIPQSFSVIWFGLMLKIIQSSGVYLFGRPDSVL